MKTCKRQTNHCADDLTEAYSLALLHRAIIHTGNKPVVHMLNGRLVSREIKDRVLLVTPIQEETTRYLYNSYYSTIVDCTPKKDVYHRLVDARYGTAGSEQNGFSGYHALLSLTTI
jgi:hypothetical protein